MRLADLSLWMRISWGFLSLLAAMGRHSLFSGFVHYPPE